MPRLTNAVTGVTVSVDDDTAANLGADWSPVEEKPKRKRAGADDD